MFGCEAAPRVGGRDRDGALLVWTAVRESEGDGGEEQVNTQAIRLGLAPSSGYFYLAEANTYLQKPKCFLSFFH